PASNGGGLSFSSPLQLAELHRATAIGATVSVDAPPDLLIGAGFDLRGRRVRTLPDTVGPDMRLLLGGPNPSLYSADAGYGYARPSNRFWKAAVAAGLVGEQRARDPLRVLVEDGVGMTDLVKRATAAASELSAIEYRAGAERVARLVA